MTASNTGMTDQNIRSGLDFLDNTDEYAQAVFAEETAQWVS